jgi:hypothetical protein
VSTDFGILLVSAAAAAYATAVALVLRARIWATVLAILFFLFVGMHAVFLACLTGDGHVLPGYQLSPKVIDFWRDRIVSGRLPPPEPAFLWVVVLAHLLVAIPRPGRRGVLLPLPATLVFVALFVVLEQRSERPPAPPPRHAVGPAGEAFLTIHPLGEERVRMILAEGEVDAPFLRVRHTHRAESAPPRPRLFWTSDGEGLVLSVRRERLFAVHLPTGETIGDLPERSHDWPAAVPDVESVAHRRRFSLAEKNVSLFIRDHGGLYIR